MPAGSFTLHQSVTITAPIYTERDFFQLQSRSQFSYREKMPWLVCAGPPGAGWPPWFWPGHGPRGGVAHGTCERAPGTLQTSPWAWGARPAVQCLTPKGRSRPAPASCTFALAATFLKTHAHPQEGSRGAGSTRAAGAHPHLAQQSPAALEPGLLPASCVPRPMALLSASLARSMEPPGLSRLP